MACCNSPVHVLVSQDDSKFVYKCLNCGTLVVDRRN